MCTVCVCTFVPKRNQTLTTTVSHQMLVDKEVVFLLLFFYKFMFIWLNSDLINQQF